MFARFGLHVSRIVEKVVPDPFVIAVGLTWVTALVALVFGEFPGLADGESRSLALLDAWRDDSGGMWKLLGFGMQMCLVLVTGHALASSNLMKSWVERLAAIPTTTASAAAGVAFVACVAGLINWGLGLVLGALLARDVGRSLHERGIPVHYPLIVAAGYTGLLVWHGGLSGSAPLSMTTEAGLAKVLPPAVMGQIAPIELSNTIFSSLNVFVSGGLILIVPAVVYLMSPKLEQDFTGVPKAILTEEAEARVPIMSSNRGLEQSSILVWMLVIPLAVSVCRYIVVTGVDRVGLNQITVMMLIGGLLLHGSLASYTRSVSEGAAACGGIMIQFPLYAGIMAMMVVSGLGGQLASTMVALGDGSSVPILSFFSAAITNLFVPSGGGQWAIQGPIALESGLSSGIAPGKMVMSVAYGDQLTNMLQPFWALPLLSITKVKAKVIVGYTTMIMFVAGCWVVLGLSIM